MVDLEWGRAVYVMLFWYVIGKSQFHTCGWSKQKFAAAAQVGSNLYLWSKSNLRSKEFLFLKYFFLSLFGCAGSQLWHVESLIFVVARKLLEVACGIQVPYQGLNTISLHWESQVLDTKPPGKSPKNVLCSSPMGWDFFPSHPSVYGNYFFFHLFLLVGG